MLEKYENHLGASIQTLVFDCTDPESLARFYAKLLGGTVSADSFGGYTVTSDTVALELGFQTDEDYSRPVWPGGKGDQLQMLHIDIKVNNGREAAEYALSIGATMPEEQFCQPDWDVQWITLLDPDGHPFCLWDDSSESLIF